MRKNIDNETNTQMDCDGVKWIKILKLQRGHKNQKWIKMQFIFQKWTHH